MLSYEQQRAITGDIDRSTFGIFQCVGGECQGYNAMHNLDHFNRLFFRHLLHADDVQRWLNRNQANCLKTILSQVSDQLKAFVLTARQLLCQLHAAHRCFVAWTKCSVFDAVVISNASHHTVVVRALDLWPRDREFRLPAGAWCGWWWWWTNVL